VAMSGTGRHASGLVEGGQSTRGSDVGELVGGDVEETVGRRLVGSVSRNWSAATSGLQ
jgi:hypothetical protein